MPRADALLVTLGVEVLSDEGGVALYEMHDVIGARSQ